MPKSLSVLFTFFLVLPSASAEIFKCTGDDGKTIYQNFRCEIDSIGSKATAAPPKEQAPAAVSAPEPARPRSSKSRVADAEITRGEVPRIGMTKDQVRASSWGEPIDIVGEEVMEGWTYSWYYDLTKTRSIIFDVRGRVSEITQ